jgi:hypothetical protein
MSKRVLIFVCIEEVIFEQQKGKHKQSATIQFISVLFIVTYRF